MWDLTMVVPRLSWLESKGVLRRWSDEEQPWSYHNIRLYFLVIEERPKNKVAGAKYENYKTRVTHYRVVIIWLYLEVTERRLKIIDIRMVRRALGAIVPRNHEAILKSIPTKTWRWKIHEPNQKHYRTIVDANHDCTILSSNANRPRILIYNRISFILFINTPIGLFL